MKIRTLIVASTFLLAVAARGSAYYGNYTDLPQSSSHSANYLLGSAISVDQPVTLSAAGIIFRTSGYDANVGLYSDVGGHPSQLLATTGSFLVGTTGRVETAFLSTPTLGPGTYWFMADFDAFASVGYNQPTGALVDYRSLTFTSTLPTTFGTATEYSGQSFNYYLVTVPEPQALWVLGLGLVITFMRRRRFGGG